MKCRFALAIFLSIESLEALFHYQKRASKTIKYAAFYTLIGIYKMLAWADPIDKKTQKNFRWPGEVFLALYVMPFFEEDGTGGRV